MYGLKRTITLFDAVMINLGAIIGAGIFVIIGIAIGDAGPSIFISILISAIVAMLTGICFSRIAMSVAKEGGTYEYAKSALSPFAGFVGGWMWMLGNIIAIAAVSLSLGGYANVLLGTSFPKVAFAVGTILAFALVNIYGIKNSAKTITFLVLINIVVLVAFIAFGIGAFRIINFAEMFPNGLGGTLLGASIIFFAFTGFSRVTTIGEEVIDPERTIPRAIIISIIISTVFYIAIGLVAVGLVPYGTLAHSSAPLSVAIAVLHNNLLGALIALGGVTATAGVTFTGILGVSRVFFAMGRDRELPGFLGSIDKFSTPRNAIVVTVALSIVFMVLVSFGTIVEASNSAILIAYGIVDIAALNVALKEDRSGKRSFIYSRGFAAVPVLALASIGMLLAYLIGEGFSIAFGLAVAAILFYAFRTILSNNRIVRPAAAVVPKHSEVRTFGRIALRFLHQKR
jgi:APA family basic amino acid/polyamine antiporter